MYMYIYIIYAEQKNPTLDKHELVSPKERTNVSINVKVMFEIRVIYVYYII